MIAGDLLSARSRTVLAECEYLATSVRAEKFVEVKS